MVAYACFTGLISNEEELQDVEGAEDDTIPEDDDWGYHFSPSQLAGAQLSLLAQACDAAHAVRVTKEVRGHDLARRENAVVRLAAVTPLALVRRYNRGSIPNQHCDQTLHWAGQT